MSCFGDPVLRWLRMPRAGTCGIPTGITITSNILTRERRGDRLQLESKEASRRPVPTRHEPHVLRAWAAVGLPAVPQGPRAGAARERIGGGAVVTGRSPHGLVERAWWAAVNRPS